MITDLGLGLEAQSALTLKVWNSSRRWLRDPMPWP